MPAPLRLVFRRRGRWLWALGAWRVAAARLARRRWHWKVWHVAEPETIASGDARTLTEAAGHVAECLTGADADPSVASVEPPSQST